MCVTASTPVGVSRVQNEHLVSYTCVWWVNQMFELVTAVMKLLPEDYLGYILGWTLSTGSRGLMVESRTHNRKVASSSLGPAGIVGGGSESPALSPPLIPRLRWPWARHRSTGCPLLRVCVCSLLCVCTLMGRHTWLYVTSQKNKKKHELWKARFHQKNRDRLMQQKIWTYTLCHMLK